MGNGRDAVQKIVPMSRYSYQGPGYLVSSVGCAKLLATLLRLYSVFLYNNRKQTSFAVGS